MRLGVLILVGGQSSRMGSDKASLVWGGRRAVDRLAGLGHDLGAIATFTAGAQDYGLPFVADPASGGGPVVGLAAGGAALLRAGCDRALALAVDAPTLAAADLEPLIKAPSPGAAFVGLNLPLAWDLALTPTSAGAGWAVRRFIDAMDLPRLLCPPAAEQRLRGANTPDERQALLAELAAREGAGAPGDE